MSHVQVLKLNFDDVTADNWKDAVAEAEMFVKKIQKAYDKPIMYILCKYLEGDRARTLTYFHLKKLPHQLVSLLYFLERETSEIQVNQELESIFLDNVSKGKYKISPEPVTDDELSELLFAHFRLDLVAFTQKYNHLHYMLLNFISDYGTVPGLIKYMSRFQKFQPEKPEDLQ